MSSASSMLDAVMRGDAGAMDILKEAAEAKKVAVSRKDEDRFKITTVLNDDDADASTIYEFLNVGLGKDWWEWEIETIDRMILIKYGVALEEVNHDKVLAIRHVCRSDGAFSDWYEFNQAALAFCGCIADFECLRNASPGMAIATVKTLNLIRPDREGFFGEDVLKYICVICINEGLYAPPPSVEAMISKYMADMVSPEQVQKWPAIKAKYAEIVKGNKDVKEDEIDIQARRMLKAEGSALTYYGNK